MKDFEESRDKSTDPAFVKSTVRELTKEAGQYSSEVSVNYDNKEASGPVSKLIEKSLESHGLNSLAELDELAKVHGVTKALQAGFK